MEKIFRAFSADRASTLTLHPSVKGVVSEMILMRRMVYSKHMYNIQMYTYHILQKLFLFFPQKSRLCAGQRRLSTNVGSGTIPASTVKSVKQR